MVKNNAASNHRTNHYLYVCLILYVWFGSISGGWFADWAYLLANGAVYAAFAVWVIRSQEGISWLPLHAFIFIIVLLYWISVLYAVDRETAILEAAKYSAAIPLSLIYAGWSSQLRQRFWKHWAWAGTIITGWGWLFGLVRDGRLESVFGYANVYAIFVLGGIWCGWQALQITGNRWYYAAIIIQAAGLVHSGSRAVMVLSVLSLMAVVVHKWHNKKFVVGSALLAIGTAIILGGLSLAGIMPRWSEWNGPELALRLQYWQDGATLLQSHWLAGLGGGGWAIVGSPSWYFVKYVHQHYIQIALDVGTLGLVAFAAMIIHALARGYRSAARMPILVMGPVIVVHIAFDIDLAFPLVASLFTLILCEWELGGKRSNWNIGGRVRQVTGLISIICVIGFLYLSSGYALKEMGVKSADIADMTSAERQLDIAARMLPWSHTVRYEKAKAYVARAHRAVGEEEAARLLRLAQEETKAAASIIPQYRVYEEMLRTAEPKK